MDISSMMQKAQEMQAKMAEMQEKLMTHEVTGSAGAGMVSVVLNGRGDLRGVTIDPSLFSAEDKDVVEDLIVAAHGDAKTKVEAMMAEKMKDVTGGMGLPSGLDMSNLKMPF